MRYNARAREHVAGIDQLQRHWAPLDRHFYRSLRAAQLRDVSPQTGACVRGRIRAMTTKPVGANARHPSGLGVDNRAVPHCTHTATATLRTPRRSAWRPDSATRATRSGGSSATSAVPSLAAERSSTSAALASSGTPLITSASRARCASGPTRRNGTWPAPSTSSNQPAPSHRLPPHPLTAGPGSRGLSASPCDQRRRQSQDLRHR